MIVVSLDCSPEVEACFLQCFVVYTHERVFFVCVDGHIVSYLFQMLSIVRVTTWQCISVVVQVFQVVAKSCCYLIFNCFVRGHVEW